MHSLGKQLGGTVRTGPAPSGGTLTQIRFVA